MTEVEHAIFIIQELEDEWYAKPGAYASMKKSHFELLSYSKWAFSEIKRFLRNHSMMHPVSALELFMYQMDKKACETTEEKINYIFSIACDVARDVLDVLHDAQL